ncbi:MAG: phage tail sheath family protein [Micromonosporaceae bacterium]|nr:phage tail sheath family protein [Micromonosporaceae bacterium]
MSRYQSPGVYVEEVPSGARPIEGAGTAIAAFVGLAAAGPYDEPVLVSNWTQFTETFGEFVDGCYLGHAVYGFFLNGGGRCYVIRVGGSDDGEGDAPQAQLGSYRVRAIGGGRAKDITVEVADADGDSPAEGSFKLVVKEGGKVVESYDQLTASKGRQNVVTAVKAQSKLITIEATASGTLEAPPKGSVTLSPAEVVRAELSPKHYTGGSNGSRSGLGALEAVDEATIVCVPDLMAAYEQGALDLTAVATVQKAMIDHCEVMGDRMAILDPPPGMNAQQVSQWRTKTNFDSRYACMYYPWISVGHPANGQVLTVPPSGHMAGVWGRNDDTRGVHKAPANEVIRGALAPATQLTRGENALLNPEGINCIRSFPGRGIRIWGARTLSSDSDWRYLNVRRLFNFLEESIMEGTQWVVFEPNDHALWAKIRRTIESFLLLQWRQGALFGATPDEAFYVKCDAETNPAESIDAGQVICEIGVAPVKPAEFVIFRLAQFSGGASLVNE